MPDRLQQVVETKQQLDNAQALAREKREQEKAEKENRKKAAAKLWVAKMSDIHSAIEKVNERIGESGLTLTYESEQKDVSPAISRDRIKVIEDGEDKGRKIVLNVNAYGLVQAVFLVSHSGRGREFENTDANEDLWIDLITDFLEQVFEALREKQGS